MITQHETLKRAEIIFMWDFLVAYFNRKHNNRRQSIVYRDLLSQAYGILTPYEIADGK